MYDLATGNAAGYKAENKERLKVLLDPSVETAVLKGHEYKPKIIYHSDIVGGEVYWIYEFACDYYNKKDIVINEIERKVKDEK